MRKKISIVFILCFIICNFKSQNLASYIPKGYKINLKYENDFNRDKVNDVLLILNSIKENQLLLNNSDSISTRKLIILLGNKNKKYTILVEKDDVVPCKECGGKCDNLYSDISFSNGIFSYTTCNYPFSSDSYNISTYRLNLKNDKIFYLIEYHETYYKNAEDEQPLSITLYKKDIINKSFDFFKFNFAQNSWVDQLNLSQNNISKFNDIACGLYKKQNYSISSSLLKKILQKFPDRAVAYLNLADCYWSIGNKELAKENYKKYIDLMKSKKKNLNKIPKYARERIK